MKQIVSPPPVSKVLDSTPVRVDVPTTPASRPRVVGKFIFVGDQKFYVRGVTYGTFRIGDDGYECLDPEVVERDFEQMARNGVNSVRTYTTPPRWVLDVAQRHGLYVLIGLVWDQYTAFLDDPANADRIERRIRESVRDCAGHDAVLGYAIGNEIPSSIVRWYGHQRIAEFLERLHHVVKSEDPESLVTYVNYPTTEYLELPFLDFFCFNVYLESQDKLESYLARLQNIAGERPLVLAEIGLDSRRNGEDQQAQVLDWQIRTAFAGGCAGVYVFAWTDEWFRTCWIEDWDFGLTDRQRQPKAALAAVRRAFGEVPFPQSLHWPRVSVIVCTYNGAPTLEECLEGLMRLDYPDYEVIVVDDGSTDESASIASRYDVHLITGENQGLSSARNTGLNAATGEIVAYLDDDAFPDPDWLIYLASAFLTSDHVGIGGPNITPASDGPIAQCVANAPGNPVHVLLSDREAEHVPGCNMAFRKENLQQIGGFDTQFRVAGDDVDVCWRLQERGWTLGFSPAAMVWHHRRNSIRAFWRQQRGYGEAEALLERKWPSKYSGAGSLRWNGRLYGQGLTQPLGWNRGRIYQGILGQGLFQSLYPTHPNGLATLLLMPEWFLVVSGLGVLMPLGLLWSPLLWVSFPLFTVAAGAVAIQAGLSARRAQFSSDLARGRARLWMRLLTGVLHIVQPLARLFGHLKRGLTPWRRNPSGRMRLARTSTPPIWSESWASPEDRLNTVDRVVRGLNFASEQPGAFRNAIGDRWDLEVRGGLLGAARMLMLIEEHGMERQLIRFRIWPRISAQGVVITILFAALSVWAVADRAWGVAAILAAVPLTLFLRTYQECADAGSVLLDGVDQVRESSE